MLHRDKLTPLVLERAEVRALRRLVQDRRSLVEQRVRFTNQLTAALKEYFPQVLKWFDDKGTALFCEFLQRWDTPEKAVRAKATVVEKFFKEHHVRYAAKIAERIAAMQECVPLTTDMGVVLPAQHMVRALLPQIVTVLKAIDGYDKAIAELEPKIAGAHVFRSFPAAADVFAPRLLAVFGEDRTRFGSAAEVQRFCGVAPVTERSGQQNWVHWRFRASKFQRQTLVEWAALTIPRSYWAEQYYHLRRGNGAGHQKALRALAFKWVRILFRCWQTGETYDETRYLKTLARRGSPAVRPAEKPAANP